MEQRGEKEEKKVSTTKYYLHQFWCTLFLRRPGHDLMDTVRTVFVLSLIGG